MKASRIHFRDTGRLNALLEGHDDGVLFARPLVGASREDFVIERILRAMRPWNAWFRAVRSGGELDLLVFDKERRIGFEVKFNEAPEVTRAMHDVAGVPSLDHLFVVRPGRDDYPVDAGIGVLPICDMPGLRQRLEALSP